MANAMQTVRALAVGARRAKGDFEGTAYDYTKVCVLLPQDASKGDAVGSGATEYPVGKSDRFNAISPWFIDGKSVEVELDLVTTVKGGVVKQVVSDIRKFSK